MEAAKQLVFKELYEKVKYNTDKFDEEKHCVLLLQIMSDPRRGTMSAFCSATGISEDKFYQWIKQSDIFRECYAIGKVASKQNWEVEANELSEMILMPGASTYRFEVWKMQGWSRFGIGKLNRIRLALNSKDKPQQHYQQLIEQAAEGDFTAAEFKQLMESINIGLNVEKQIEMQTEIDELKADLNTMKENSHVDYSSANQGITQKD